MSESDKYVSGKDIRKKFQISNGTLQRWANSGKLGAIRLSGPKGKRLYCESDLGKVISGYKQKEDAARERRKVCYARVSSQKQRPDLERQIQSLKEAYPDHEIVSDVGSGINWKRPHFLALLDSAMRGNVEELVVAHKDRLCRFAYDLVSHVLKQAGCRLLVQDSGLPTTPNEEEELRDDLLAIVTVFVASNNGKRAAAHKRARKAAQVAEAAEAAKGQEDVPKAPEVKRRRTEARRDSSSSSEESEDQDIPDSGSESDAEAVDGDDQVDLQPGSRDDQPGQEQGEA